MMILLGVNYLLYQNAYTNKLANLDGSLHVIMSDLGNDIEEDGLEEVEEDIEEIPEKFKMDLLHVRLVSYDRITKKESVISKSSNTKNSVFTNLNFEKNWGEEDIVYQTLNAHRVAVKHIKVDDKTIQLLQTAILISFEQNTITTLIAINVIIFLFSLLGVYLLISRTLLPVHNVVVSVNEIEAYDYKKRVSAKKIPNEIQELVDTFNKLLVRHEESFSKISQFSSDVSHELKTPLTSMRGEMEVGLRRERTSIEYQKILKKSLFSITKIQELMEGLLFLAKSDKLKITSLFEEVYVDEVITECVHELEEMAHEKSIQIKINPLPLTVKGDSKLLKIACINLLKNAILYSPNETGIEVSIEEDSFQFILLFQDQGVGISKEDMEHIFDRFYRVDKTQSRVSGGMGLGLSIVKMILDIHGFDISIESEIGQGTLVKVLIDKD
jgi:heavy metal sensor kinase